MSTGWPLLSALHTLLKTQLTTTSVSFGLPTGIQSGDYLGIAVADPEASGRAATAFSSNLEWSISVDPRTLDEVGEVSLAAVAIRGDDELDVAVQAAFAIFDAVIAALRGAWSSSNLLGVTGLWDLKGSGVELVPAQLDGAAVAMVLIRLSFQATI